MSHSPLSIQHVSKWYQRRQVLFDVGFDLNQGEIFGLIGLNGAGKTTLIKVILDLIHAKQGQVSLFGKSWRDPQTRKLLSYLPEKFQPSRYLRGMEYLELSLSYYGKTLDKQAARDKAAALDLDPDVLTAQTRSYSKGMGQKLGLVGAFMIDAPLLILDEPMSGLDPSARIFLKEEMFAAKRAGKTIFFSSHILADIDEVSDRVGVIHDGHLHFLGTPEQLRAQHPGKTLEMAFLKSIQKAA